MDPICAELTSNIYLKKFVSYANDPFPGERNGSETGIKCSIAAKVVKRENMKTRFSPEETDRIIQMAWEDRTTFDAIEIQFGLTEGQLIDFMRAHSLPSSFRMWRKRMTGRSTKHAHLRSGDIDRFKCSRQKNISNNKISKR
jgi:uncharacterized protein (TIGR03643 family)